MEPVSKSQVCVNYLNINIYITLSFQLTLSSKATYNVLSVVHHWRKGGKGCPRTRQVAEVGAGFKPPSHY